MLLSIVIPAFKVEDYIERCLRSLQDQNLEKGDYEVIVVNDGSPDRCAQIVESLQLEFRNIKLHNQENKGVSSARNKGVSLASGEYILFIDPDDYVRPNSISGPLKEAKIRSLDMFLLGYEFLGVDGSTLSQVRQSARHGYTISGIQAYHLTHGAGKVDPDRSWAILFRRQFLESEGLTYLGGVPYLEDGEFLARSMCLSTKVSFCSEMVYVRTTRPGSATNSNLFTERRSILGFISCAENLSKFQQRAALTEYQKNFLDQPIAKFALLSIQACISVRSINHIFEVMSILNHLGLRKLNWKNTTRPYRAYCRLYNISVFLFILLYVSHVVSRKVGLR